MAVLFLTIINEYHRECSLLLYGVVRLGLSAINRRSSLSPHLLTNQRINAALLHLGNKL